MYEPSELCEYMWVIIFCSPSYFTLKLKSRYKQSTKTNKISKETIISLLFLPKNQFTKSREHYLVSIIE